jgi:hypothetical protein
MIAYILLFLFGRRAISGTKVQAIRLHRKQAADVSVAGSFNLTSSDVEREGGLSQ